MNQRRGTRTRRRPRRLRIPRGRSGLENGFIAVWHSQGERLLGRISGRLTKNPLPAPETEYVFHPTRLWRFDFAWPARKLAVEIEGGQWGGGRHTTGSGLQSDCEKINAAQLLGWMVLRYTTSDLQKRPVQVIEEVMAALRARPLVTAEQKELLPR